MLQAFGLARLGRDAEIRFTGGGEAVASLSLAFDLRVKGEKVTQWVEGSLWGKQAEALQEYLTKGKQIAVQLEDLRMEEFADRDGNKRAKLVGRVSKIDLAGGREGSAPAAPAPRQAPAPRPAAKTAAGTGFDDMDDGIPF